MRLAIAALFSFIFCVFPALAKPRVLIIGDSISIGYTDGVIAALSGDARVERVPDNAGSTKNGLERLDEWLGAGPWDVIHFNFGLHDLMRPRYLYLFRPWYQVPLDDYVSNLRKIVHRLKKTGATLIYATTTPVPVGAAGRTAGDEIRYNAAALAVMRDEGVAINDLHAFIAPRLSGAQRQRDVHFNTAGHALLASAVTSAIRDQIQRHAANPIFPPS